MEIDEQQIVKLLRERGDHAKATEDEQELPDKPDSSHTCAPGACTCGDV